MTKFVALAAAFCRMGQCKTLKYIVFPLVLGLGSTSSAIVLNPIPNFKSVNDSIYRGGRPSEDGMNQLPIYGIKTDINLQGGDLDQADPTLVAFMKWWEPGETAANIAREKRIAEEDLQITFIPAPLNSLASISADEDLSIDRILAIMGDKAAQPVFVHCEHGHDRTGLIIALYRVKFDNMTAEDAHREWVASGHKGIGAYFTGYLDTYFYKKAAKIISERSLADAEH